VSVPLRRGARPAAAVVAAAAWFGLVVQLAVVTGWRDSVTEALGWMSLFYTSLGNLFVAVVFTGIAAGSVRCAAPRLVGMALLSILLIGGVYNTLLLGLLHPRGWHRVSTVMLHDVTPLTVATFWMLFMRKGTFRHRDPWLWVTLPLGYLAYALVRGFVGGRYPYPFLDLAELGAIGVLAYVVGIGAVFLAVGHLIVVLDQMLGRSRLGAGGERARKRR